MDKDAESKDAAEKKDNLLKPIVEPKDNKLKKIGRNSSSSCAVSDTSRRLSDDRQLGLQNEVAINREEYLQAFRDLSHESTMEQLKNKLLHKRLGEYYKKRKLTHVLKPVENYGGINLEERYQQKLFVYEELKDTEAVQLARISGELEHVDSIYKDKLDKAVVAFKDLHHLLKTTATGLVFSKKGKVLPDKVVDRLLSNQQKKQEQINGLRLRYLRARNAVTALEETVRDLETLAPGLYVAQYEQLRIDNNIYMDKYEEWQDQLTKSRTKCTEHNQILAHIREKMQHTEELIDTAECDLGDAELDWLGAREELNTVKVHRDKLRQAMNNERQRAGILMRRDLLFDYETAFTEVEELRQRKHDLLLETQENHMKIRAARRTASGEPSKGLFDDDEDCP